jgi:large subunit ribosomal protein L24e
MVKCMKCTFCGNNTPEGRGKMFVKNDGKILYFCNSKCQKNFRLGRTGKAFKWTKTAQKETAKPEKPAAKKK